MTGRHEYLQKAHDEIVRFLEDRTKSRFTREDADKMAWRLKDLETARDTFKDKVYHDLTALRLQLTDIQSQTRVPHYATLQHVSGGSSDEQTMS